MSHEGNNIGFLVSDVNRVAAVIQAVLQEGPLISGA
jgi:Na+-translocating ferredoxin:NAD+ oxidoreductase RnfC subunit